MFKKGTFNPKNLETLKPESKPFVGNEYLFQYGFTQDEGPYKGQVVYLIQSEDGIGYRDWMNSMSKSEQNFTCLWIPEEDIEFEAEND